MGNSNYYGSDLNEFIDKNCSREMTVNNIDCIIQKLSQKRIRIIESKHMNEGGKKSQKILLDKLTGLHLTDWTIEIFMVRGNPPYDTAIIIDIETGHEWRVNKNQLISWLNFEYELMESGLDSILWKGLPAIEEGLK